ncbi:hypothetical protein Tco_1097447, partial [Tanacetum coccineum]
RTDCRALKSLSERRPAGNWLTLSNKGEADVLKAILKPCTHIQGWKGNFFYIEEKIIPRKYPELLLEDNKLENPSKMSSLTMAFRNFMIEEINGEFVFLQKETTDYTRACSPSVSINTETPATYVEPLNTADPSQFAENMADSKDSPTTEKDF